MAEIYVYCEEEDSKRIYTKVIQTALEDLILGKSIIRVDFICKEKEPYFILGILPKATRKMIKLRDMAEIVEQKKEGDKVIYKLKITDETYLPYLLKKIHVLDQPSRFEIVTDSEIDLDMDIYDTSKDFLDKIMDFSFRVFPEGMRIKRSFIDNAIVIIASERPLKEHEIEEALKLKERLESS
ncbi:methanogenesis marker 17 protein [Methanocaldococcus infernus]|uniref:Methanogenesis marker protein 17 n=1 Tax=Methanocaldococcus infernus (strain DSM 11812 / JCM 15783 / ME) TaxID=573063 RepID=D5VS79_METIM|nr:methanogenesis marker 17 protein [Methanocaldococcus infernus]ADG13432.1 methanogenesis marker protein 17 [Methanocaldococcus infernus ME]